MAKRNKAGWSKKVPTELRAQLNGIERRYDGYRKRATTTKTSKPSRPVETVSSPKSKRTRFDQAIKRKTMRASKYAK